MSSNPAQISVIIPTYNRAGLLQVAVESVLAQTYPAVEIIVVDDGSTDETATLMVHYAASGRVTYFRQANQGVAAARNTGFQLAAGHYLTFLDDDDFILASKLESQARLLDSRLDVGLVHCGYYHAAQDGSLVDRMRLLPEGHVLPELVCRNFMWVGAPLIRRQCLEQVGLFNVEIPGISADWELWLRIALAGYPFACVQEPLGAYRVQQDSMLTKMAHLESATLTILDNIFARPHLPAHVAALKEQAYSRWHLWLSCRNYASADYEAARRNLAEALSHNPGWLETPADLIQRLSDEALSPRVANPLEFVAGLFDHLPGGAETLAPYRSQMLGKIYLGQALRAYGLEQISQAKRYLIQAIALDPALLAEPEAFARALGHYALSLPINTPLTYVSTVFQNLPAEAQSLVKVQSRVLSDVNIGCAFEDYFIGRRKQAAWRVLRALQARPAWLRNKGVVSVLLKSLPGLLAKEQRVTI